MVYDIKDARPAPKHTIGVWPLVKHKLFATPINVVLTLLGLYLLYTVFPPLLNFLIFDATFTGGKEDIIGDGARWIFIGEKLNQFIYGFYPEDQIWRINLIVVVLLVATIGFRAFSSFKIKALIIGGFPVIAYILIAGGFGLQAVETTKWGGFTLSILVASVGIICSFPIGIALALGRASDMPIIKTVCIVYIEFIRGVPLITILFMASVVLPLFFPENLEFDKLLRALIGITLFQAAYIAEVLRGGLQAIPKGQYEAADSLSLSYWQGMGLIVLPQALKISIPNLVGSFISLFKDTSLILIIGLFDMLAMVSLTASDSDWLGFELEGYLFVLFLYWIVCFSMSKYARRLENRFNTELKSQDH